MSLLSDWIEANRNDPDHELAVRNYTMNKEKFEREHAKAMGMVKLLFANIVIILKFLLVAWMVIASLNTLAVLVAGTGFII